MQHKPGESHPAEKFLRKPTPVSQFADWTLPVPDINDRNQTLCDNRDRLFPVPQLLGHNPPSGAGQVFPSKVSRPMISLWAILSFVLYSFREFLTVKQQPLLVQPHMKVPQACTLTPARKQKQQEPSKLQGQILCHDQQEPTRPIHSSTTTISQAGLNNLP